MRNKTVRGNQALFMNKELSKAIMEKSRPRNKIIKNRILKTNAIIY